MSVLQGDVRSVVVYIQSQVSRPAESRRGTGGACVASQGLLLLALTRFSFSFTEFCSLCFPFF